MFPMWIVIHIRDGSRSNDNDTNNSGDDDSSDEDDDDLGSGQFSSCDLDDLAALSEVILSGRFGCSIEKNPVMMKQKLANCCEKLIRSDALECVLF